MREARSKTAANRVGDQHEHNRNRLRLAGKCANNRRGLTEDRVGSQIDQLLCERLHPVRISGAPAKFDSEIAAFRPPQLREAIPKCRDPRLRGRVTLSKAHQHADHPIRLLRARRERPYCGSATK